MATASAGRAARVRRQLPRVPRALAVRPPRGRRGASGQEQAKARRRPVRWPAQPGATSMTSPDPEIERLRADVHCAVLLERWPPPWRLDRAESTKNALKYRRDKGEILIVNHAGRGWFDPQSDAKGDIFDLVQHLDPGLNFGAVRKVLREFAGLLPALTDAAGSSSRERKSVPPVPITSRWARRPRLRQASPVWLYLTEIRHLPPNVLAAARAADILREGPYGSAWFAHQDEAGAVTHVEIRGPAYKGSLTGGTKILFRLAGGPLPLRRLAVAEAPIDALSLAAFENIRSDTLYAATGGGMGPKTVETIERLLADMAVLRPSVGLETVFCSAADANPAGERYAARHHELAVRAGVPFERFRPPVAGGDWNDVLKTQRTRS